MMQTALLATNGDRVVRSVSHAVRFIVADQRPCSRCRFIKIPAKRGSLAHQPWGLALSPEPSCPLSLAQKLHGEFGTLIRGWNAHAEHQAHHDLPVQEAR